MPVLWWQTQAEHYLTARSSDVDTPIFSQTIEKQRKALIEGRLSSVELVTLYLARIDRFNTKLNAFAAVFAEEALQAATEADDARASGKSTGVLDGIPIGLKDIIEYEDHPTSWGSRALDGRQSSMSATVVQKLQQAGAIIIGKTQSVEFALGGWGTNQYLGTPWNPWDLETHRVPGGSSSGSGVAVAAGLTSAALGTDTGGSVRLPSAFCGLVGLKPTFGRISNHGVMPLSHTLDTVGPLARSVGDAALIYDVLQGPDTNHIDTLYQPLDNAHIELKEDLTDFCLAALPDEERRACSDDVNRAYDRALTHADDLGATIITRGLPHSFETYRNLSNVVISAEGYAHAAELVDQSGLQIGNATLQRVLPGKTCSARDYLNAMMQFKHWRTEFKASMRGIDALLTPTTTGPAIPVVDVDEQLLPAHYTRATNVLGLCGLAIPNGLSEEGLPLSLCLHGHPYTESTILRIGWSLEQQFKELAPSLPGLD